MEQQHAAPIAPTSRRARHSTRLALALALTALGSSCVSQARHEEALAEAKYYQRNLQDLEAYQNKLEAENERLRGELALRSGEPIDAAATKDIDQRLAELSKIMNAMGATPGQVEVLSVEGGYGLRMPDSVLFDSGSADLKSDGKDLLLEMAKEINTHPYQRIWVRGHTDADPVVRPETKKKFPYGNIQLSAARALEVAAVLGTEGGIPSNKLVVAGFGPSEPVAPNTSATDKAKNRRVEIFVIEDPDKGK